MFPTTVVDPDLLSPLRPLRRAEYDALVELGYFDDERIELLRGMLVQMSPRGGRHARATMLVTRRLTLLLGEGFEVRPQAPLAVSDDSEPEPDIAVVPAGASTDEHPQTALLVVEVAESSLRRDRDLKAPLYAQAGVVEYWIVDLTTNTVQVHTDPAPNGYRRVEVVGAGARLRPLALPALEVDELFSEPARR